MGTAEGGNQNNQKPEKQARRITASTLQLFIEQRDSAIRLAMRKGTTKPSLLLHLLNTSCESFFFELSRCFLFLSFCTQADLSFLSSLTIQFPFFSQQSDNETCECLFAVLPTRFSLSTSCCTWTTEEVDCKRSKSIMIEEIVLNIHKYSLFDRKSVCKNEKYYFYKIVQLSMLPL